MFTCPSLNGYKKQVDLRFRESLPTPTYAEHFCCVLLFKMPSKRAGAHMPREPAVWLGRLAQPNLCNLIPWVSNELSQQQQLLIPTVLQTEGQQERQRSLGAYRFTEHLF